MDKIKRFRLKDNITLEDIKNTKNVREGGSWINQNSRFVQAYSMYEYIDVDIGFPEDLSKWNDFDYVLVIDDSFGQPYTPFYNVLDGDKIIPFPFLETIIRMYNKYMMSREYLEEIKE